MKNARLSSGWSHRMVGRFERSGTLRIPDAAKRGTVDDLERFNNQCTPGYRYIEEIVDATTRTKMVYVVVFFLSVYNTRDQPNDKM